MQFIIIFFGKQNSPEQKAGIEYPPFAYFAIEEPSNFFNAKKIVKDFFYIFYLILGYQIKLDKIIFDTDGINCLENKIDAYYYFPILSKQAEKLIKKSDYVLYPFGKNLRFDTSGLPDFPLDSLSIYFNLNDYKKDLFRKFNFYSNLPYNSEEKFLGLFRLVEKLTLIQKPYFADNIICEIFKIVKLKLIENNCNKKDIRNFISKCCKENVSKYNTEACIIKFLKSIHIDLKKEIKFDNDTIQKMVKLRNDITHVNDYYIDEEILISYIFFLDFLTIYLLLKEIKVEEDKISKVLLRYKYFYYFSN